MFFDGALHGTREHAPSVGFYFKVGADAGIASAEFEDVFDLIAGGMEGWFRELIEGDMEMDSPLFGIASIGVCRKAVREIDMAGNAAVGVTLHHLVEISRFIKGADGFDGTIFARIEGEGGGEVDLGNADAFVSHDSERTTGILILESEVAAVIVDADAALDLFVVIGVGEEAIVKTQGLLGVLEVTEWFGFESEVEVSFGDVAQGVEKGGEFYQVFADDFFVRSECLE